MVTKRVELPATAASARREREGKPQTAQQEHTEQGAGQGNVIPRGRDVKSAGGERPSLGQQQRSRSRCKVRKVHLVRALVTSMGSESLPALERPTFAGHCVVGTGCGARRPIRGVKAAVAEVLPREDRSGGTGQDALTAQRSEQALSSGGRAGLDDREGVAPRRPVSGVAVGAGAAQAEPTEPLRELGCPHCGGGQGGVKLEQAGKALCDGRVVVCCVSSCQVRGQYAQQVVSSGGCATLEQQPCGLQVIKVRDALQQAVMLSALALEVTGNKIVVAERRSQHGETLTVGWEGPVSDPDRLVSVTSEVGDSRRLLPGSIPDASLAFVETDSCSAHKAVLRASYRARVLSGKATM